MEITFLELRRNPKKLLDAVERREEVTLSRRGRIVAKVTPADEEAPAESVASHPAFGMWADHPGLSDPSEHVRRMRRGRFHDL